MENTSDPSCSPGGGKSPPPAPEIRWAEPSPDAYAQVFAEMMEQIAAGQLMKSVPAIPQFGEMSSPTPPGNSSCGPSAALRPIIPTPGGRNGKDSAESLRKHCSTSRAAAWRQWPWQERPVRRMKGFSSTTTRKSASMKSWRAAFFPACPPTASPERHAC